MKLGEYMQVNPRIGYMAQTWSELKVKGQIWVGSTGNGQRSNAGRGGLVMYENLAMILEVIGVIVNCVSLQSI